MKMLLLVVSVAMMFLFTSVYGQEATKKTLGGSSTKTNQVKKDESQTKILPVNPPKVTEPKDTKSTATKGKKPIKGRVASLTGIFMGGDGKVSKDEAVSMASKGEPIVFVVGDGKKAKIYFVYNSDGTFGGKNLAKYANNKFVGIIGKTMSKHGINFIIADMIESMD
jgi:hypothetical protein